LPILSKQELFEEANDGIWRIDFQTGKSKLLISLSEISRVGSDGKSKDAIHKVNHLIISPSGDQFIFIHRYYIGQRRFDQLMLADSSTGDFKLLSNFGMVSHCFWLDDKTIFGYLRGPGNKDAYWIIDVNNNKYTHIVAGKLDKYGDGHPHVNGDWFVTDTYPDKSRMQNLILVNIGKNEIMEAGEFFHGFKYKGETRCDLHPRFSPDGRSIFFDSVFSGKRKLYKMEVSL
jgi:Tol biopolymer transport system component